MDASVVLTLIQTFLQVLDSPVSREIESVWYYKSQLQKLRDTMSTIKALFLDAEKLEKQQGLSNVLRNKLQRLQEAVYRADDLFDEVATVAQRKKLTSGNKVCKEVHLFFSRLNQLCSACKMSHEIRQIRELLDGIKNDHHIHDFGSIQLFDKEVRNNSRETHSFVCEEDVIIGRDEDKRIVIDMLIDTATVEEALSVVSIVGIGGLGKTALAQLVYNGDNIQREFQLKMWVCVSDDFNVKYLLGQILAAATNHTSTSYCGLSMDQLQAKLRQEFDGKKYLLVLDDIWNEDPNKWHELRKLLIQGGRGSRIIVNTRSMRVANIVGSQQIHELKGLSEQDSWKLFERMTLKPGQLQMEAHLVDVGKAILRKCLNVPLAIRVTGSLLQGQGEEMWQNLKHTDLANIEQNENGGIIPVLKISYNYLPSHLKSCFTYCAVFPKDYEIIKEELIYLWMAQGLIVPSNGQSFEDLGEDYFKTLMQRCFFQNVKRDDISGVIVSCNMHDLIHGLAKEVAGIGMKSTSDDISSSNDKTRHIFIDGTSTRTKNVEFNLIKMKRLRTCLGCQSSFICSYGCFPKMRYLRVLQLTQGYGPNKMKKLPSMIGQFVHLRYLDLSCNPGLSTLPNSITQLYNLQTLTLKWCWSLKALPRELSKLVNLRHLDIWDCYKLRHMPPGMDKMTCLHKLTMFVLGGSKNATCLRPVAVGKLGDLKCLNNLRDKIRIKLEQGWTYDAAEVKKGGYLISKPHLDHIEIIWNRESLEDDAEALLQGLQPHPNVKQLSLVKYPEVKFPSWGDGDSLMMNLSTTLPNLVELHLEHCAQLKHVPLLSQLCHLKLLRLCNMRELEYVEGMDSSTGDGAPTVSGGTRQGLAHESVFFPSLETLDLVELPKLKGWWEASSHSRTEIDTGEFDGETGNNEEQQQQEVSSALRFPSLSAVVIISCPNLTNFPSLPKLENLMLSGSSKALGYFHSLPMESFQHLSSLYIKDDDEIERLAAVEVFQSGRLSSLRQLIFSGCSKLKSVTERGVWENFTALETLALRKLPNLELEDNEGEDTGNDIPWEFLAHSLCSLRLDELPKMVELPIGMRHLTALRSLYIENCKHVEEIPRWISCLTSLQHLRISNCPRVKSLPEELSHLTCLNELSLIGCSVELKERCQEHTGADWHIIQYIPTIRYNYD